MECMWQFRTPLPQLADKADLRHALPRMRRSSSWFIAATFGLTFGFVACGDQAPEPAEDDGTEPQPMDDGQGEGGNAGAPAGTGGQTQVVSGAPELLSLTGLYKDGKETLAEGVRSFVPRFALYSDGATKRRWIYLPPGNQIDTADADYWKFPTGTKLWKEFSRDGTRVETRLLEKLADGSWLRVAYEWRADQSDAEIVPAGKRNAGGTEHDIPSQGDCNTCHASTRGGVLGFSAIQLDHEETDVSLDDLNAEGALSEQVTVPVLPGSETEQSVLGYFHVNCGTCHNPTSPVRTRVNMDLRLRMDSLTAVTGTPLYESAVNKPISIQDGQQPAGASVRIAPGAPSASAVFLRLNSRGEKYSMPPLGTEKVDEEGRDLISAWITDLE